MGCSKLVQRRGIDAADRGILVDQLFAHHVDGGLERGFRRALAGPGLEHEELAFLHREFHVLHVAVMLFQPLADGLQFGKGLGHRLFHRGFAAALALAHDFGDGLRRADARHHVLALGVDEEFAVEQLLAGGGIAGEGDAGGRGLAAIAEHHRLHRHRRAPILRNIVQLAIGVGAGAVPGAEHRPDGAP